MLPKQIVYIIEQYKFEIGLIYGLAAAAVLLSLQAAAAQLHQQRMAVLPYTDIKYPILAMPAAGVMPVTTFRAGTVIQVIHSGVGFGNHVVIDHGNGLTSLYGHMANTTVSVGQHVRPGDIIGHEGSTGASTGPHVHFEIDLNGKPVNPHGYIQGNP